MGDTPSESCNYEMEDKQVKLPVTVEGETVWLNCNQMFELLDRDVKTIGKHINNTLKEELSVDNSTVAKFASVQIEGEREVEKISYIIALIN